MKSNIIIYAVVIVSVFLGLTSCDNSRVYESWKDMPTLVWHKDSAYITVFNIEDTTSLYNMNVGVRNNNLYPYRNMWLMINIAGPEAFSYQDTVRIDMADNTGRWYGERSASLYTYVAPLYKGISLPKSGEYTFSIKHGMRKEKLGGVASLGFRVEYSE